MRKLLFELRQKRVIRSKNAGKIYDFARDEQGADMEKLTDAIVSIKDRNNGLLILWFAHIKGANVSKLQNWIIEVKDARYIYEFAKSVDGADLNSLTEAIIATKNAKYMYFFLDIPGVDINKLTEGVIATKNDKYIYAILKNIKGANIDKLQEAIVKSGEMKYIVRLKFINGVNNSLINKIIKDKVQKISNNSKTKEISIREELIRAWQNRKCMTKIRVRRIDFEKTEEGEYQIIKKQKQSRGSSWGSSATSGDYYMQWTGAGCMYYDY